LIHARSENVNKYLLLVILVLSFILAGCSDANTTPPDNEQPGAESTVQSAQATALPEAALPGTGREPLETSSPLAPMEVSEADGAQEDAFPELPPCNEDPTSANMEGPYYSPGSPQRTSLIDPGMPGVPILILGRVFDRDCNPIASAKVDFWQADMNGVYDNQGYTLRGYVITGEDGYYDLETIEPGLYTGRPPHIHVKVFDAEGRELLTTQLYFPGSEDSRDVGAAPDLLVSYSGEDEAGRQLVFFNFVVSE
jgi:protocatechuate 3,4-dioxygenase beta subunit